MRSRGAIDTYTIKIPAAAAAVQCSCDAALSISNAAVLHSPIMVSAVSIPAMRRENENVFLKKRSHTAAIAAIPRTGCGSHRGSPSIMSSSNAAAIMNSSLMSDIPENVVKCRNKHVVFLFGSYRDPDIGRIKADKVCALTNCDIFLNQVAIKNISV